MKKLFKIGLIIAGIAAVALAATGITLSILFPPERIKAMAMPYINEAVGREVKLEKVGITFLTGVGIKLQGLEVTNSAQTGFSKEPMLSLDAFVIKFSPLSVFGSGVKISSIILDEPVIRIEVDKKGSYNFDDLAFMAEDPKAAKKKPEDTGGPALPIPVSLKKFAIKNGTIIYNDRQAGTEVTLGSVNQQVFIKADKKLEDVVTRGKMDIRKISVGTADLPVKLKGLHFALAHDLRADLVKGTLSVSRLALELQQVAVSASGTILHLNTSPYVNLKIQSGKINLADLLREIPQAMMPGIGDMDAKGILEINGHIKGDTGGKKPLDISGNLKIVNGMFRNADLPKAVNDISADINYTANDLHIKALELKLGDNPVSLKGTVKNFENPRVNLALKADVDLGVIKDLAELPDGMTLAGKVKADITANGLADPDRLDRLNVKGGVSLSGIRYTMAELAQTVSLDGRLIATNREIRLPATITAGQSRLKLDAVWKDYLPMLMETKSSRRSSGRVTITAPLLDGDALLPPSEDPETEETAGTGGDAVEGPIMTDPLPPLDATATIRINRAVYNKMILTDLAIDISMVNNVIRISTNTGLYSGKISDTFTFNARNHRRVTISNAMNVNGLEANDFISNFNNLLTPKNALYRSLRKTDNVLYGKLSITSDITGSGGTGSELTNDLAGDIFAKVHNGRLAQTNVLKSVSGVMKKFYEPKDIKFQELDAELKLKDGAVVVEKLEINSSEGDWNTDGTVGFDGGLDLVVSNRLNKANSAKIAAVQNKGKDAVKGLLKGTQLAGVSGLVDGADIPVDSEGRVTLQLAIKGNVDKPKPALKGFGKDDGNRQTTSAKSAATDRAAAEKKRLEDKARKEAAARKAQLEKEADAAKAELAAEAKKQEDVLRKKAAEEKKKLDAAAKKKADELKKKASSKLKGFF